MVHPALMPLALLAAGDSNPNPITPSVNELIYGLISFLVFFAFMAKYVLPRANQALADRRSLIEGKMEQAEADRAEAQRLLEDYRSQLADARGESARILEAAHRQGEGIRRDAERTAQESADRIVAAGAAKAEADRQLVMAQLRHEIGGLSVELAERIVGASLSDDDRQRQLIDDFIRGVGAGAPGGAEPAGAPAGG